MNPYLLFIQLKNKLYDSGYLEQIKIPNSKVISIGNLNAGGSGKTPFILYCVDLILKKQETANILIVTKSYKADLKFPRAVDLIVPDAPGVFGDEACLIKKLRPHVDVWSGPTKFETVLKAVASGKPYDFIFVDDGFSHRKLFRHLDIVLFDVSRSQKYYRLFPWGFMREPFASLRRSQLVVLTKTQNAHLNDLNYFKQKILKYSQNVLTLKNEVQISDSNSNHIKKVVLFTGIANPESLKMDLQLRGYEIVFEKIYPDHYEFPIEEQMEIKKIIRKYSEAHPVMTEKDIIKLTDSELKSVVKPIQLKLILDSKEEEKLYENILR